MILKFVVYVSLVMQSQCIVTGEDKSQSSKHVDENICVYFEIERVEMWPLYDESINKSSSSKLLYFSRQESWNSNTYKNYVMIIFCDETDSS